jgi:iron complex transport system permease protein
MLALVVLIAFSAGKYPLAPGDLLRALESYLFGGNSGLSPAAETVIWSIRLPRVAAGVLVGSVLAAAGAAYQGMFRNPLVSPDILGVSSGAGLGAAIGIYFGLPMALVQGFAFGGGLAAVGIVYRTAGAVRRHDPVMVLVLSGVAVGACSARASRCSRSSRIPTPSCPRSPSGYSAASTP